jgi:hypothetical protein
LFPPQSERPSFAPIQYTSGRITVLYILIYSFFIYEAGRQKDFGLIDSKHFLNLLLISSWMSFWFVSVLPKHLNFATFSDDSLAILYNLVLSWVRMTGHVSRPTSLLVCESVSVFSLMVCTIYEPLTWCLNIRASVPVMGL